MTMMVSSKCFDSIPIKARGGIETLIFDILL